MHVPKPVSRREFMRLSGLAAGGGRYYPFDAFDDRAGRRPHYGMTGWGCDVDSIA